MFPIKLDKPLVVFDIESTGVNTRTDRIIELAAIKVNPDGTQEKGYWLINPGVPIPQESTAVHGITDEVVANEPTFKDKALEILAFFTGVDLAGFNAGRFDIPMLCEEFTRAGISFDSDSCRLLDAQRIFHSREPRDLTAAVAFYCDKSHDDAHGAEADTQATLDVIVGQFEKYPDLPQSMDEIDRTYNAIDPFNVDRAGRLRWVNNEITINFGKKKGTLLKELVEQEPSFVKWILKNDFPADMRTICDNALRGFYPEPPCPKSDAKS